MNGKLMWILSLTSLHPGVGRSEEAQVDLPVQRDEFGLPTIWASSLKGAIRSRVEKTLFNNGVCVGDKGECATFLAAFGPRPDAAHEHASGVVFLDAKLVAIPARSLRGVWLWATSPMLLNFVKLYAKALGVDVQLPQPPAVKEGQVALTSGDYAVDGKLAVINEMEFEVATTQAPPLSLPPIKAAAQIVGARGVAYLHDNDLLQVVKRSLLVQYRVRLSEKKTVETGPWSEEYIPPFTVFASGIYCARKPDKVKVKLPKKEGQDQHPVEEVEVKGDLCQYVAGKASGVFWLGGKETVGKGLAEVIW